MFLILTFSFLIDFATNGIIANCWVAIFSREGFSLSEAAVACGLMCLSTAFFELPTGYLADRVLGRKGSVFVGILLIGIGMLVLGLSDRFAISASAMVISGLGTTFISGAKQAWLRNVVTDGYPNRLKNFFFDVDIGGRIATIMGIWASAYLIEHQTPSAPWLMGALVCGFCLIFAFLIPKGSSDQDNKKAAIHIETAGIGKYLVQPILLFVLISTAFFGIEDAIRGIIFQPVVLKLGSENAMFLAYQATITLGPRLLGAFSYRNFFSKYPRPFHILTGSIIGIATLEIGISQVNSYLVFAVMWSLVVFLFGIFLPLKDTVVHQILDELEAEKWRATIVSIDSLLSNVFQAATCFAMASMIRGEVVEHYFLVSGVALVASGLALFCGEKVAIRKKDKLSS